MPAPEGNQYALGNDGGRPTDYKPEYTELVRKLGEKGFTDEEIADFIGVSVRTIYRWKVEHEEFCQALKLGKDVPDDRIERSLYHRANGFEWYEEQPFKLKEVKWVDGNKVESERVEIVKVLKRVPPDPTSAIFWLKNRRKDEWRDKTDHALTGKDGGPVEVSDVSDVEGARRIAYMLGQAMARKKNVSVSET